MSMSVDGDRRVDDPSRAFQRSVRGGVLGWAVLRCAALRCVVLCCAMYV